ncbi:MAG: hypothetical protein A3F72_03320 [Bacteroidetes bacterium RIFCSPLOWO2_12_FULL_35_15]|nr:MAG: hypothetical protein A3F72_03320 [Bacteroidetes bacterium RIFCSPLOWO2_12_FULL_35_15]
MKKNSLFYFLLLFLFSGSSFGSVTLLMRHFDAAPGTQVTVPVRVKDFLNIVSVQGTIQFDQTISSFVSVQDFGLSGMNASSFGTTQTSTGKLSFSWFDASLVGVTLPDTAVIFSVKFNVTGTIGQLSTLSFVNAPTALEVINNAFVTETLVLISGAVHVQNTVTPASVTLKMDTVSGTYGSQVLVSLRGVGFTDINSVQGTIQFNPAVVSYGGISYYGLPGLGSSNFGTSQIASGKLNFSWLDATLTGQDMANNAPLFTMVFNLIGVAGDQTVLSFATSPTPLEVTDSLLNTLAVSTANGRINITGSTLTQTLKLKIDTVAGPTGSQVIVPVRAWQFKKIISAQGTISFNTGIATYANVEQFGLPGMDPSNFGTSQVNSGKLMFSWSDATLVGQTLADSSVVFAIRYNIVGSPGTITPLDFINAPTPVEFIDSTLNTMSSVLVSGRIRVTGVMTITTNNPTILTYCTGDSVTISYTTIGTFNGGNDFILQLSDATGSFTSPTLVSTISAISAGTFHSTIPLSLINGVGYRFQIISTNPGITGSVSTTDITIYQSPAIPALPVGGTLFCLDPVNTTYTTIASAGAISYTWTLLPAGAGILTSADTSAEVNWDNTFTGNAQVFVSAGNGTCQSRNSDTLDVSILAIPAVPAKPTGIDTVICASSPNSTYFIQPVANAVTYDWQISPVGAGTISGVDTSAVVNWNVLFSGTASISVRGTNSICSGSYSVVRTVNVLLSPSTPVLLSGNTSLCINPSNTTYIISYGANTTSHTWSLITPGAGVITPTDTVAIVDWNDTFTGTALITVTASNGICSSMDSIWVTITATPNNPGAISGGSTICSGIATTYSVINDTGATSYTWSLPLDWTGTSTTDSIYVTTGSISGSVSVIANNSCGSSSASTLAVSVNPTPIVTASGSTTICSGNTTPLSASGATDYSWLPVTGLDNPLIANPGADPTITTTYTVTGTTGTCSSTDTVKINVDPTPSISVSGTTTICNGYSTILTASGAASYSWLPNTGLSDASIANPTATPSVTTTYTVTGVTLGCSATTTVTVTVNPLPVLTTSGNTTICTGSSAPISASGATNYSWLPITGLSNPSIENPGASPISTTTYTVTGTSLGCSDTAQLTVTIVSNLVVSITGTDSICAGSSTNLTATGAATYDWLPITGLDASTIANPIANPTTTTTYTVTGTSGTCSSTATITITVTPLPVVTASGSATICAGASTPLGSGGATTFSWLPTLGLSNPNIANPSATPIASTTYTVTGTTSGCSSEASVLISVNPTPTASAGSNVTICSGTNTTLNASGGTTYLWSPSTGLSATNIANPIANPTTTRTYTVTVGNGGSCTSSATVTVTVNTSPTVNAGLDATIACGGSTTLNASGGSSYSWSPITGLSNPNIANPVATPPYSITYTVTVSNGTCSSTDTVLITTGNLTANAGSDIAICTGNSTTLNGTSTGGSAGTWVNLATSTTFAQNVGTYTALTGGTIWLNATSPSMDDVISSSITIPAFKFNNVTYTSIYISTNGFITFGATAPVSTNYTPISSTGTYAGAIAPFGVDITRATAGVPEISYQQVGSEFIIQWQDMGRYLTGTTALDRISFQVRLNTATNEVKIVYAATSLLGTSTYYPEVGLRGANNTFASNVKNRNVISTTGAWVNSTAGTSNLSKCYYDNVTPATIPASGTTFTFTPPSIATTNYSWAPATGLSATNIANPIANPTTTTTYTLTVTNGSCTAVDQVMVSVTSAASVSAGPDVAICIGNNTTLNATGGGTYSWAPATGLSSTIIANPVATPSTTTTYTVTVTNGSCNFTDNVVVTVNSIPAQPTAITGASAICDGTTNTYSSDPVSGASSYIWTLPAGWSGTSTTTSIGATADATNGTIIVKATNSCGTSAPQTLFVTVNPIPAVTFSPLGTVCLYGPAVTLSGGSPVGGVYSGNGVSGGTFSPSAAGLGTTSLTYTYSDVNSCSNIANSSILVDICTGVETAANQGQIIIYPNPFTTNTTIKIDDVIELTSASMRVYDVLGKEVLVFTNINTHELKIERKDLRAGIYFYQFINNSKMLSTGRIIIE